MAPGGPSPPSRGSTQRASHSVQLDSPSALERRRARNRIRCESLRTDESRGFDRIAAAVSADAHSVAESSRDVSDPTSGPRTLTPGSVRGSLTSRLRV